MVSFFIQSSANPLEGIDASSAYTPSAAILRAMQTHQLTHPLCLLRRCLRYHILSVSGWVYSEAKSALSNGYSSASWWLLRVKAWF